MENAFYNEVTLKAIAGLVMWFHQNLFQVMLVYMCRSVTLGIKYLGIHPRRLIFHVLF